MLYRAWSQVIWDGIEGDYVEFGVYKGARLMKSKKIYSYISMNVQNQIRRQEPRLRGNYQDSPRRFIGLDTFSGMPDNNEGHEGFVAGSFNCSENDVHESFKRDNVSFENVELIQGLFKDSNVKLRQTVNRAAIVNIDGDLYESAVDALDAISHAIDVGTILLFDDYNCFKSSNQHGERKAFREFSESSNFVFEKWFPYESSGQSFLCVDRK